MAAKKSGAVRRVLGNAAVGAAGGVITGAMIDPSSTSSWAKTGTHALIGGVAGIVGGANGRSQHMRDAAERARR